MRGLAIDSAWPSAAGYSSPSLLPAKPSTASLPSLPLDGAGRFRGHVVDHAVDALDLVDDAGRGMRQERHVELIEIRGHAVGRSHGAQRDDVLIGAAVTHHADGLDRQDHRKRLPDVVVEPGAADLLDEDLVGKPQDLQLLAVDRTGTADREPRARERMPSDERLR